MINGQPSVCIVGAGAAGLSAAWYLNKAGYTNVTVIESAGRVGGKCWSVPIPPTGRVVEMGAVEVTPAYPNVLEIAQEVGAPMQVEPARGTANLSTGQIVWNATAVRMASFPGGVRTGSYGEVPLPPKGHAWGVFKVSSYYLTLEALQGQRNTFYSGGLLSFETVHNVVSYSKSLVARNFPACPGSR